MLVWFIGFLMTLYKVYIAFSVLSVVLSPLFSYDKSHARSLHERHVLRYAIRTIVLFLRHYTNNSKRNHSFGADGVLDLNNTIFLSF